MTSDRAAGSVASVNVGLPRDVSWHGRSVRTGVWKRPVPGVSQVRRLNIDGDGQGDLAGHGGENRAVFVYQLDSYEYWQRELGRHDFEYGQFGENFTVSGLPDDEVRIGDRFEVGEALFEVTQPRVTCYRVGIRMNDPRMPGAPGLAPPAWLLLPGAARGRCSAGRSDREGRGRARGNDRRGGRRAALPARPSA